MKITKLIQQQSEMLKDLDKRFEETPTAKTLQSRLSVVTDKQEARITSRIKSLETERDKAVQKFDAAIKLEQQALKEIQARRIDPQSRLKTPDGKSGKAPGKRASAATKATATKATATKAASTKTRATKAAAAGVQAKTAKAPRTATVKPTAKAAKTRTATRAKPTRTSGKS